MTLLHRRLDMRHRLGAGFPSPRHPFCYQEGRQANMEASMRALIVDDDQTFCEFLTEVLADRGIEGVWTTDGVEGYTIWRRQAFDLVISDIRMPSLLGTELAERLKRDNPQVKIILISAFADESSFDISRSLGVPLLSKPFVPDRLLEMIAEVLDLRIGKLGQ
jgi:CheY-like chemotaxis protein